MSHTGRGWFTPAAAAAAVLLGVYLAGTGAVAPYRPQSADGLMKFLRAHKITGEGAKKSAVASGRD